MSWSPELFIGELRPWPDTVHVVRGKTDETRLYVPERTCRYEFVANIVRCGISLNSCGLKCSECGRDQIYMEAPKYCPECGCKVVE